MPRISVVLPMFRTAPCLRELHQRLVAALEPISPEFELVFVDDGSPDNTWEIITELAGRDTRIKGVRLSRNFGQHPAIAAGFQRCRGELVVLMDSDLQDRPEDIPRLVEKLTGDVEIVYTVKTRQSRSMVQRLTSRLYFLLFFRITGLNVPKNHGIFRAFTRKFLHAVLAYPERNILYGPMMFLVGFKWATVDVVHDPRPRGGSSYTFRKRLSLAFDVLSYTDIPQRVLMNLGALTLGGCFIYAIILVVVWFFRKELPPGLTMIAFILTVSLGIVMLSLGIIGMYVFRIYQEVLNRPRFIVAEEINPLS